MSRIKIGFGQKTLSLSSVGSMVQTIGQSLSSVQRHMYFAHAKNSQLPSGRKVRVFPYDPLMKKPFA